ncbi:hypothetical protein GCM10009679_20670 [Saccharothrix algeriensis]|uniref:Uncharacterized protein n=1 Tax=Catellatospora bangladeshensis TaxID=310355 RepID=A0A8J3NK08_9ACTN|nr:hypothetical protein Cba03nite_34100 [Catellatospora bangladeshensis]
MASLAWRRPIDAWLADLGGRGYSAVGIRPGLAGNEISGQTDAADVGAGPPSQRTMGYLDPDDGRVRYLPRPNYQPGRSGPAGSTPTRWHHGPRLAGPPRQWFPHPGGCGRLF